MWEIRQQADPNTLDLYIYGDVEGDGYDWWTDEIIRSETSANTFREELAKYPDVTQINLYINSRGGSVFEDGHLQPAAPAHGTQDRVCGRLCLLHRLCDRYGGRRGHHAPKRSHDGP